MSYTAPDFFDDAMQALGSKGYEVHECDGDGGFYFTWTRPDGRGDIETGEVCTEEAHAWSLALAHWLDNTDMPFDEEPAAYLVTVDDHQYAVIDKDDAQLVDDCTNAEAIVEPLFTTATKGT